MEVETGETGVVFCPTCGNLLLVRVETEGTKFFCRTCPYVYSLGGGSVGRLTVTRVFKHKTGDDVLGGEEAWKDVAKTEARCVADNCTSRMAYFRQMQIRSADEPMTTFYRCVSCGRQWKED